MALIEFCQCHVYVEAFINLVLTVLRGEDYPHGEDVIYLLKCDVFVLHLVPDGVGSLHHQELLAVSDILITDYSSVMWDFSLQKKPVFLFHPDLDKYQKERGYYLSFGQMPYIEAFSNEEMCRKIKSFDEERYHKELDDFLEKYGSFDRGRASADVAEQLIKWLNGSGEKSRGGGM